jgi:hypothetical protein
VCGPVGAVGVCRGEEGGANYVDTADFLGAGGARKAFESWCVDVAGCRRSEAADTQHQHTHTPTTRLCAPVCCRTHTHTHTHARTHAHTHTHQVGVLGSVMAYGIIITVGYALMITLGY